MTKRDRIMLAIEDAVSALDGTDINGLPLAVENHRAESVDSYRRFAGVYDGEDSMEHPQPYNPSRPIPALAELTVPVRMVAQGDNPRTDISAIWNAVVAAIKGHAPLWDELGREGGLVKASKTSQVQPGQFVIGQALGQLTFTYATTD